jgi:ABC-type phosphate transport system auxiliary subunit
MDNSNLSQNIQQLDLTLQEIQTLYDSNVAEFSEKFLIYLNAKSSFLNDLVYFVHGNMEQENHSITKSLNDLKDRNSSSIMEAKESLRLEKQSMESRLKDALQSKIESAAN